MLSVKESTPAAKKSETRMSLRVYNTLSKTKEAFEPVTPGQVGMYLCGPTVYKPSHIGHMVGPVIFDAVKRYLVYNGFKVTFVVNVTDVDDKLINESRNRNMTMAQLADEMTGDYLRNLATMGIDSIDHFPRATQYMGEIIKITQNLIDKGFAYESAGDVYFDVGRDPQYGKLSNRDVASMQGEGGDMAERKHSPADFALWKSAKPGEPAWESPWGQGRPGWHIECSAMSRSLLGETFDIHGGGLDLVFPHHENEIAQSECCHGKPQAKYWMHNGLMQASNEVGKIGGRATREAGAGDQVAQEAGKMGKSKGASAFSELLTRHAPETIRFFLLSTHYRRPIDYSEARIEEVNTGLEQFYRFFKRYERIAGMSFYKLEYARDRDAGDWDPGSDPMLKQIAEHRSQFLEAMDDDFNTGGAVGVLFDLVRTLNKYADDEKLENKTPSAEQLATLTRGAVTLRELGATLGLFREASGKPVAGGDNELVGKLMALMIELRAMARGKKDFAMADHIRKALGEINIALEDRPGGTEWTLK